MAEPLQFLATAQLQIIDAHFKGNREAEQRAFEDFGQGVLFDDRREESDKIYKMDTGGPNNPPIVDHRWHGYTRAGLLSSTTP